MEEILQKDCLEIYSARLIFRRNVKNERTLSAQIRFKKRSKPLNKKLPFPDDIRPDEVSWIRYKGEVIAVYHRHHQLGNNYKYVDSKHTIAHTSLDQKLEKIVRDIILQKEKY